jgi:hypothetical protein
MANYELYHCSAHYLWLQYSSLEQAAKAKETLETLYGPGNIQIKITVSQEDIKDKLQWNEALRNLSETMREHSPLELAKMLRYGEPLFSSDADGYYVLTFCDGKFEEHWANNQYDIDTGDWYECTNRADPTWKNVRAELKRGVWHA